MGLAEETGGVGSGLSGGMDGGEMGLAEIGAGDVSGVGIGHG